MLQSDDDVALLMPGVDVAMGVRDLLERIAPIDDGSECSLKFAASTAWRMRREPPSDVRHVLLEIAWYRKVKHTCTDFTSVLEVVRGSPWHQNKRTLRCVNPSSIYQEAHDAFDNIEDIIFCM